MTVSAEAFNTPASTPVAAPSPGSRTVLQHRQIPLLVAYGVKSEVDWCFYPLVLVFMLPFVVLPAAIGTTLGLLLTAIVPRQGKKLVIFAGMLTLSFGVYLYFNIFHSHSATGFYGQ